MKELLAHADEVPVTLLIALAYVTLAFLTDPFSPTSEQLEAYGMLTPYAAAAGGAWRLLAAAFLHGGIVHLLFNLSMLLSVGPALERSLGSLRYAALYVVAAVGGNLAVCLLYPPFGAVIGGSGALFGMLGALVAMNMRSGRHVLSFLDFDGPRRLLGMIAANLVIGLLLPFVSNSAHVGGLLAGFAVTFLWLARAREPSRSIWHWRIATAALFASCLFASLMPVVRYEWLWNQAVPPAAESPALSARLEPHRAALRRAAAMAYFHLPSANEADVERMQAELFEPERAGPKPR